MKHYYWLTLCLLIGSFSLSLGQEKGLFKKKPTITPNSQKKDDKKKNEFEELEEDTPKLQFQTQFQPVPQTEIPPKQDPPKADKPSSAPAPMVQVAPIMSERRDTTKVLKEAETDVIEERIEMRVVNADSSAVEPDDDDVMVGGSAHAASPTRCSRRVSDSRPRPNCRAFRPVLRFSGKWPHRLMP